MKLFGILVVVCLVRELNAVPSPLQSFAGGDQTTGSKWPPYENAGQDYWALKAQNVHLGGQAFDDSKNIVKKGVQQVPAQVPVQPAPVQQQAVEVPQSGPTPGLPLAQPTAIAHQVAHVTPVAVQPSPVPAAPVPTAPQANALQIPPAYQNHPFLASNRGLYAYYNGRQYLLRNYYPQLFQ